MKRILLFSMLFMLLGVTAAIPVSAERAYSFEMGELTDMSAANEGYNEILNAMPEDLKNDVEKNGAAAFSVEYFLKLVSDGISSALTPSMETFTVLLGAVILSAVFSALAGSIGDGGISPVFSICSGLCTALAVWDIQKTLFDTVKGLLDVMNNTMLLIVPVMEAVYISSGNVGTAAVSATGVNLMIGLCEGMFAKVLYPGGMICISLSVCASVTKDKGVLFMSKALRGMICGILILLMALMSFVLILQVSAAQAADTFAQRTIRFAIGSYLPIIGGSVSESFSVIASSVGVIKQMSGAGGIAVLLIAFVPPFVRLIAARLSMGAASTVAGMLDHGGEKDLLSECGATCTLMLAVCAAGAIMYVVALGIFCATPVAMR